MRTRRWLFVFFLAFTLPNVFPADAHALFQLSVSPRRGGQSIRFESAEPGGLLRNEEVTLSVTTDLNAQYRILQTVYQPLANDTGSTMPAGAFIEFSPSSPSGTLRTQLETPVTMGQTQIYTSASSGVSDEFVLVFNVHVPETLPGGVYHTQITFTAELVNAQGGVSPSTTTLDVRMEINPKFRITVLNAHGGKSLELGHIGQEKAEAGEVLTLQIESNIGTKYQIFQQLTEALSSSQGSVLEDNALTFAVKGASPQPLSQAPVLLYQSNDWGAGDQIEVSYVLTPPAQQKAGIYSGNLSFRVQSSSPFAPNETILVPVKVEIESIFSLETQMESGSLNFGTFHTGQEKQEKKVTLKVRSNLGEPYQILQVVPRKMTNEQGAVIPDDHFQFSGQSVKTGVLAVPAPKPVQEGETLVFTSDKNGTPEEFVLDYILTVPKETKAGSYHSELKYSMTTV